MRQRVSRLLCLALLGALPAGMPRTGAPPLPAQDKFLLRAARVYTGTLDGDKTPAVLEPGAVLVVGGVVAAVGTDLDAPVGVPVIDLGGMVLMPGAVVATSSLAGTSTPDESNASAVRAIDAFDPFARFPRELLGGVTTAYLSPGEGRLFAGQGAVVKLFGPPEERVLRDSGLLEVQLGDPSLRPPLKQELAVPPASDYPILPGEAQLPTTRLSQILALREAVALARGPEPGDLSTRALRRAEQEHWTFRLHADSAADVARALQAVQEFSWTAVLTGLQQGADVADSIAASGLPAIVEIGLALGEPPPDQPADPDRVSLDPETAAELWRRGVRVAVSTPLDGRPEEILLSAALARRGGLTVPQAVAAITSIPAALLGVGDRVGTLSAGKDADILVLSGEPFSRSSHVQKVYVGGRLAVDRSEPGKDHEREEPATVVRAGTVLPGDGTSIAGGAVLLRGGKIAAVGRDVAVPPNARVIDAGPAAVITPGFIDCNSHLEFGDDRSSLGLEMDPTRIVSYPGEEALEVARGGVTSVLLQPVGDTTSGTRVAAVKSGGRSRGDRVVDGLAAVKLSWRGNADPLLTRKTYHDALEQGKKYHEEWVKYFEALKKWEEEEKAKAEQAKKAAQGKAAKEPAKKPEEGQEAPKENGKDEVKTEKRADPITGKWDVTLSGGPMPTPQQGTMNLKLEGSSVRGSLVALSGDEQPVGLTGTLTGKHLSLKLDQETPLGFPTIEADLTAEDRLEGVLALGDQFQLDFAAVRTEKEYSEVTVVSRKKKTTEDGKPLPPEVKEGLEPYRRLFAKEAPVLLDVDEPLAARLAVQLFVEEFGLELVLMNGEHLEGAADAVARTGGLVVPRNIVLEDDEGRRVPAVYWSERGVPVGFQSDGVNAARGLAWNAAYAVRQGMDPRKALEALTTAPAQLFHLDDRIGALKAGLDGDLVVFSGDPFELSSRIEYVFVNGAEVALEAEE